MHAKKNPTLFVKKEDFGSHQKDFYQMEEENFLDTQVDETIEENHIDPKETTRFNEMEQLSFWHNPFPSLSCMEDLSNKANIFKLIGFVFGLFIISIILYASVKFLVESSGSDEPVMIKAPSVAYKLKPEVEVKEEVTENPIYERIEQTKPKKVVKEKIIEDTRAIPAKTKPIVEAVQPSFYIILGEFESHHSAGKYWLNLQNTHYKTLKNCDPIVKIETTQSGKRVYQLLTGPISKDEAIVKCRAIGSARLLSISD